MKKWERKGGMNNKWNKLGFTFCTMKTIKTNKQRLIPLHPLVIILNLTYLCLSFAHVVDRPWLISLLSHSLELGPMVITYWDVARSATCQIVSRP